MTINFLISLCLHGLHGALAAHPHRFGMAIPPRPLTASYHSASPPSPERYTGLTLSIQAVRFSSYPFQLRSILILDFVFFSVHIFVASAVLPVFCHQTHLSSGNHCLCLVLLGLKRILHTRCHSPLTTSAPMANRPV